MHTENDLTLPESWKPYLIDSLQFLFVFYISTFCIILFFLHKRTHWLAASIILVVLYLSILFFSLRKLIRKLPIPVIFLAAPTIPLLMLISFVSMIPLLQFLDKYIHFTFI